MLMKDLADKFLAAAPAYDDVVERFDLTLLMKPGDLVLENGDLALTCWGDIRIGSITYNGLWRFVQTWRFNEPMLSDLFAIAVDVDGAPPFVHALALAREERT
jgi:hypothetical protein